MNNNPRFNPDTDSPESLKSEIDTTRRRMDDTIDALTSRIKGRHLLDEVIGFFRSSSHHDGPGQADKVRAKVTQTASTAMHSTVDTVKAHPMPALLIGAGVAWLVYDMKRKNAERDFAYDPDYDARMAAGGWEDDVPYDYPAGDLSTGGTLYGQGDAGSQGTLSGYAAVDRGADEPGMKDKAAAMKQKAGAKMAAMRDKLRSRTADMRMRGREQAGHLGERMQSGYTATRARVSSTVEQHPLESALACLAVGVLAGLAIPTPQRLTQAAGPTARRLRDQASGLGHDIAERGKHVAQSAIEAARRTAEEEGLTAEALKSKLGHVADSARSAAAETADEEGLHAPSSPEAPKSPNPPPTTSSGF